MSKIENSLLRETSVESMVSVNSFCDYCYKAETFERFKKCAQCKQLRYCSIECQKADWRKQHKDECKKVTIDRAKKDREIMDARNAFVGRHFAPAEQPKPEDFSEAYKKLDELGHMYRVFLLEEFKGLYIQQNKEKLESVSRLYFASICPEYLAAFPNESNKILHYFQEMIHTSKHFSSRLYDKEVFEKQMQPKLIFWSLFEAHRAEATNFLKFNYSSEVNRALQNLRMKAIQKVLDHSLNTNTHWRTPVKDMFFVWAYTLLCTLPCLKKDCLTVLQNSIETEDISLLFSCIQHDIVLKHALNTNQNFAQSLQDQNAKHKLLEKLADFKQILLTETMLKRLESHFEKHKKATANYFDLLTYRDHFMVMLLAGNYLDNLNLSL